MKLKKTTNLLESLNFKRVTFRLLGEGGKETPPHPPVNNENTKHNICMIFLIEGKILPLGLGKGVGGGGVLAFGPFVCKLYQSIILTAMLICLGSGRNEGQSKYI